MIDCAGQLSEDGVVEQFGQLRQTLQRIGLVAHKSGSRALNRIAPDVGFDELDGKLNLPLHRPEFMERAMLLRGALRLAPFDIQEPQLVQ